MSSAAPDRESADHRLQLLIDSVRDYAIFMLDPDGRIATWSIGAQLIKGYRPDEIIGRKTDTFYTPEDRAAGRAAQLLSTAREVGRVEDEGWRVRKDGTRFWADVVITAIRNPQGELIGFVKVTRDLSERRKAELDRIDLAHAQESLRLRDEFFSIAAHELRTPLVALQLQIDSLKIVTPADDPKQTKLDRAARNVQRLADLISALMDVSRIAAGQLTLTRKHVDLGTLVAEVVDRLHESAVHAGCVVRADLAPGIIGSWDPLRIGQVISNVLANAYKYAAGTAIDVTLSRDGDVAIVQIRDRGPGIAHDQLENVFRRFERGTSRNVGGLGLGLYVAHEIAAAHGGGIHARNAEDGGAVIEIRLPIVEPKE